MILMSRPNRVRHLMAEEHVANHLSRLRAQREWSAAEVAERMAAVGCAIDQSAIHKIEKQGRKITVNELVALSKVFGLSTDRLMKDPSLTAHKAAESILKAWEECVEGHIRLVAEADRRRRDLERQLARLTDIPEETREAIDVYISTGPQGGDSSAAIQWLVEAKFGRGREAAEKST